MKTSDSLSDSPYMAGWRDAYRIGRFRPNFFKSVKARAEYKRGWDKGCNDFERW